MPSVKLLLHECHSHCCVHLLPKCSHICRPVGQGPLPRVHQASESPWLSPEIQGFLMIQQLIAYQMACPCSSTGIVAQQLSCCLECPHSTWEGPTQVPAPAPQTQLPVDLHPWRQQAPPTGVTWSSSCCREGPAGGRSLFLFLCLSGEIKTNDERWLC